MITPKDYGGATRMVTNVALLGFTAVLLIALALFPGRIQEPRTTAATLIIGLLAYVALHRMLRRTMHPALRSALEVVGVLGLSGILFGQTEHFQQLLHSGWKDDELIALELKIFGFEGSLGFQPYVSPALTEWMMFSYVIYFPLLPAVAWMSYQAGGVEQTRRYLCALMLSWLCCYAGFVLYPVASPLFYFPEKFTVPLEGGPFTWAGEWGRLHLHQKGGALPSPHCAAGTVILVFAWKYKRWLGIALTPVILSLYVSTVYGRYHYTSDAITGIMTAVVILLLAPRLVSMVGRARSRRSAHGVEEP
jgi:membrane-associated phospholipid phosphatase